MIYKILLVLIVFLLFTFLFKKASGSLNPTKLNIISILYYSLLIMSFIGSSLVFIGIDNHYLIQKIRLDTTVNKTYFIIVITVLAMPLIMIYFNFILGINPNLRYKNYILRDVSTFRENRAYFITCILCFISILSCIYVLITVNDIPLVSMFFLEDSDIAVKRINIGNSFKGLGIYIRNIIALQLTPLLSYISYIYTIETTNMSMKYKWKKIFCICLIFSILMKTYNYEKAPILFYIIGFYIINIIIGIHITMFTFIKIILVITSIIIIFYVNIMDYNFFQINLYSGPLGRIIFSQVAGLFLHIDLFPYFHDFLQGQSFPKLVQTILGIEGNHIRSGRIVMENYNSRAVENGTAGVMNTLFCGEAYANYDIFGTIIIIFNVTLVIYSTFLIFTSINKTPINIAFFALVTISLINGIQGGFTEYFYNPLLIILSVIVIFSNIFIRLK